MVDVRDGDETYWEPTRRATDGFDARLLREPLGVMPVQRPLTLSPGATSVRHAPDAVVQYDAAGHAPCCPVHRAVVRGGEVCTSSSKSS